MKGHASRTNSRIGVGFAALFLTLAMLPAAARADGLVFRPVQYDGSLNERAQEAIIIFRPGDGERSAEEDLILKISVDGEASHFAWVVPLPTEPTTAREDAALFRELHNYVQARLAAQRPATKSAGDAVNRVPVGISPKAEAVEVLSRKIVGSYDVAVVRENVAGALNTWLKDNGYQARADSDDVIGFYREKKYVFACVKVADAQLEKSPGVDLHPLRFTFKTGGRDGIYFPMRLTGLQDKPFDINLYIFYDKWVNDRLSRFGYAHRGFTLRWRDYDSPKCEPNAGKTWSDPGDDPYLSPYAQSIPTVTKFFQKMHPGRRFYLTNIYASNVRPNDVRDWLDDLWMFPYYTNRDFVPYDARTEGPAALGYPK